MLIQIISDIHGNSDGLHAVLDDAGKVDKVICAGDLTGYYPFVNEVIDIMKEKHIITIRGNHDLYLLKGVPPIANNIVKESVEAMKKFISTDNLSYLATLPESLSLTIDRKKVLIFHGSPWDSMEGRVYPDFPDFDRFSQIDADVVVLGQTHHPIIKYIGNITVVNPGSCGQPRDYNFLSYTLWNTTTNTFMNKRISWDIDAFVKKAKAKGIPDEYFEVFKRTKK